LFLVFVLFTSVGGGGGGGFFVVPSSSLPRLEPLLEGIPPRSLSRRRRPPPRQRQAAPRHSCDSSHRLPPPFVVVYRCAATIWRRPYSYGYLRLQVRENAAPIFGTAGWIRRTLHSLVPDVSIVGHDRGYTVRMQGTRPVGLTVLLAATGAESTYRVVLALGADSGRRAGWGSAR